ncbi:carbohydrate ABC transporter permease [Paenibacillus cymbidii]|uniref:carbohydrate ABC transporter permease n=1 Tax=Paenibacillus cymbidii TaxID=1639034 RepID=UPI001080BC5A|nr:carbohydrate ABC transporter permease [Paenibacillus cymbidii]
MTGDSTFGRRLFVVCNTVFLILLSLLCLFPLVHVFAVSFSSGAAATAGLVKLWPVQFSTKAYVYIMNKPEFLRAFGVTLQRVGLGYAINMLMVLLAAYPLSKESHKFKMRTAYVWYFVFTILFGGGLIPWYMTVKTTGLLDTIWALVLPGAVPVFNVILLLNFFRGLPREIEESAFIDGAGHWITLWRIYVPLSMPALATLSLFTLVGHWNAWFDGLILMNFPAHYPLSSYMQKVIIVSTPLDGVDIHNLGEITDRTTKASQILLASLPILLVYPFLQRFFIKGIVLGSVKS